MFRTQNSQILLLDANISLIKKTNGWLHKSVKLIKYILIWMDLFNNMELDYIMDLIVD